MNLRAVRVVCARSANVALGTLSLRNECSEGNYPKTSAEGTTLSGPSVSLHALTDKFSKSSFFGFESSMRSFRNVRLSSSWYLSPTSSALRYCVPDFCYSKSCILQISTKYLLIMSIIKNESAWKSSVKGCLLRKHDLPD